jgi:hypothetical protein
MGWKKPRVLTNVLRGADRRAGSELATGQAACRHALDAGPQLLDAFLEDLGVAVVCEKTVVDRGRVARVARVE